MNKGGVFIISGPSGSGKDTLICALFKKYPGLQFSISSITRPMRKGEVPGEKYNFISRQAFEEMIREDNLLEYNVFLDNYYGTPRTPVEQAVAAGRDILIEVDVNGAANICKKMPEAVSIFIMPPSFEELKNRLSGRGTETQEDIDRRMACSLNEIKRASEYDFIVVNRNVDEAVDDIISVMSGSRMLLKRQKHIIDEVLENVES